MPTALSSSVPGVVSVIAWKRWPPCIWLAALPTRPGAVIVKFSARLPDMPTPLKPTRSPVNAPGVPRTVAPAACAPASGVSIVMPVPGASTVAPAPEPRSARA